MCISGNCVCVPLWENGWWPCLVSWCMASFPALQDWALLAFSGDRTSSRKTTTTKKKLSHKKQLQSQAGPHKSNAYFKEKTLLVPLWTLWAQLSRGATRLIDSIEYCNRNIQFFQSSTDVRRAASKAPRGMTKTMECGSFDRKSPFAGVLRQHCSLWSQALMSPSDCWVEYLREITAD